MVRLTSWGRAIRALTFLGLCASASVAQETGCRQALALGLDVSGSVDPREYRLQIDGVRTALQSSTIQNALLALPSQPVRLMVYEWSGTGSQHILVPWTPIRSQLDLSVVTETLSQIVRRDAPTGTALGDAMGFGGAELRANSECSVLTLDISGDGKANMGQPPDRVRDALERAGITVNALVIGADSPSFTDFRQDQIAELSSYFRANVITGAGAFVQTALGYEAYAEAMTRKLERELAMVSVAQIMPAR